MKILSVLSVIALLVNSYDANARQPESPASLIMAIESTTSILIPGKTTHNEFKDNLKKIGCFPLTDKDRYAGRKEKASESLKNDRTNIYKFKTGLHLEDCKKPWDGLFINNNGKDYYRIYFNSDGNNINQYVKALTRKYHEPILIQRLQNTKEWTFNGSFATLTLVQDLSRDATYVSISDINDIQIIQNRISKEKKEAEEKRKAQEIKQKEAEELVKRSETYKGRILGLFTPGETSKEMFQLKLKQSQPDCRYKNDLLTTWSDDSQPCIKLPNNPKIKVYFSGEEGIFELIYNNRDEAKELLTKLNSKFGPGYITKVMDEKHTCWTDPNMAVIERKFKSAILYSFSSRQFYDRLVKEQLDLDKKANENLNGLF